LELTNIVLIYKTDLKLQVNSKSEDSVCGLSTVVKEAVFHGAKILSGSSTEADITHRAVNPRSAEVKIYTE